MPKIQKKTSKCGNCNLWRYFYIAVAVVFAITVALFSRLFIPRDELRHNEQEEHTEYTHNYVSGNEDVVNGWLVVAVNANVVQYCPDDDLSGSSDGHLVCAAPPSRLIVRCAFESRVADNHKFVKQKQRKQHQRHDSLSSHEVDVSNENKPINSQYSKTFNVWSEFQEGNVFAHGNTVIAIPRPVKQSNNDHKPKHSLLSPQNEDILRCSLHFPSGDIVSETHVIRMNNTSGMYQHISTSMCLCTRHDRFYGSGTSTARTLSTFLGAFMLALPLLGVEFVRWAMKQRERRLQINELMEEQRYKAKVEQAQQKAKELEGRRLMREQEKRMALVMFCATGAVGVTSTSNRVPRIGNGILRNMSTKLYRGDNRDTPTQFQVLSDDEDDCDDGDDDDEMGLGLSSDSNDGLDDDGLNW